MIKPWIVILALFLVSACSSAVAPINCRQSHVPTLTLVNTSKLVSVGNASVYTLSVTKPMGEPMGVYSDPELVNILDSRVPSCSTFVVSGESTNYLGVRVAYVLRVIEWRGQRYAYWGLSGYVPLDYLKPTEID